MNNDNNDNTTIFQLPITSVQLPLPIEAASVSLSDEYFKKLGIILFILL